MSQEQPTRSPLTVSRSFIRDFLAADPPCFALGLVEERQRLCGFLALRPPTVIPPAITDAGFRFGHSLLGTPNFVVVQFVFHFYGFDTYNQEIKGVSCSQPLRSSGLPLNQMECV